MFHQEMIFFFFQEMMGRGNRTRRKRKFFDDPEKKGNLWILFCFCSLILHSISDFANSQKQWLFETGKSRRVQGKEEKRDLTTSRFFFYYILSWVASVI